MSKNYRVITDKTKYRIQIQKEFMCGIFLLRRKYYWDFLYDDKTNNILEFDTYNEAKEFLDSIEAIVKPTEWYVVSGSHREI